jgi:hypothetical protein
MNPETIEDALYSEVTDMCISLCGDIVSVSVVFVDMSERDVLLLSEDFIISSAQECEG